METKKSVEFKLNKLSQIELNNLEVKSTLNVANLPSGSTEPAGLAVGDVWIDTTDPDDGILKVKLPD